MEIAYVHSLPLPSKSASGVHVAKMCEALTSHGHSVRLLYPNRKDLGLEEDIHEFYGIQEPFDVNPMPWPELKGRYFAFSLTAATQAWRQGADLFYTRTCGPAYFATLLGIPTVLERHFPIGEDASIIRRGMTRRLLDSGSLECLVVVTDALADYYADRYRIEEEDIIVAHDAAEEPTGDDPMALAGSFRVGYVGSLYEGRGIDILSRAAEECPWADIHIAGGSEQEVEDWRERTNHLDNMHFHGYIPHAAVGGYLRGCDVLAAPYQRGVEMFGGNVDIGQWMSPLKIFEYMASGTPMVLSLPPGVEGLIEDEEHALLCPPDDVEAWAQALERLRDDPELSRDLAKKAREEWTSHYTWQARAERLLKSIPANPESNLETQDEAPG